MSDPFEAHRKAWKEAFIAAGHTFVVDEDGVPDFFALSVDTHNGPACAVCGWMCCHHCTPASKIPPCKETCHE